MSSRSISRIAGQVSRSSGFQQNIRNRVFRSRFWAGVAADAATLLASPHPEESGLPLQGFAFGIQQFDLQRLIPWNLYEEGSIAFHLATA
jgi:hypothetical protein